MRDVNLSLLDGWSMPSGVGVLDEHAACVMAQAVIIDRLERGEPIEKLTDTLDCACGVLRALAIGLNDGPYWESNEERAEFLRPIIPLLLDSKVSRELTQKRAYLCADRAVRLFAPSALDAAKLPDEAMKLRNIAPIVDEESALSAASAAAQSAQSARSAALSAAQSAQSAESAQSARSAAWSAQSAAESAARSSWAASSAAESAQSAARSAARSAAWSALSAARSAAQSAQSAPSAKQPRRDELLQLFMDCGQSNYAE